MSKRERYFTYGCVLACAVAAVDRLAAAPYVEARAALTDQARARTAALGDARALLERERRLRGVLAAIGPAVDVNAPAAEVRLARLLHDMEQRAGLTGGTFHRVRSADDAGFTLLSFHVSAGGDAGAAARLLYAIETSPIPLRVDELHLTPRRDGAEVQLRMTVSTLCRKGGTTTPRTPPMTTPEPTPDVPETAAIGPDGGRP